MTTATALDHERVGPYRLVRAIGAGGSARVDLARIHRAYNFQRHVVLKRPLEHLRGDPKAAASLRREARIGGLLGHPNLVGVLDAGTHDGYDYIVLEYIDGASLRTLMTVDDEPGKVRDVPLGVVLALVIDVARGLHHAHELCDEAGSPLGLVHRDVSPNNVLVGLDGSVKLADFGIAKETRVTTLSGSMHGTVTYMAPEQCRGHAFDRRADIWALGVILYELVTGTRLFWADNDVASLHRVLSGTIPRPRKVRPSLSPALESIVMAALAQDPVRRTASARDLADALERHAADTGELLTARAIAGFAHDVIRPPRDVSWIAAATIPAPPRTEERSLVELIAASDDGVEPVDESFPSHAPAPEHAPAPIARRSHRGVLAAVVATGLAGGVIATHVAMREPSPTTAAPALAPPPLSPPPPPIAPPPREPTASPAHDEPVAAPAEEAPAPTRTKLRPAHASRRVRRPPPPPTPPSQPPAAGSGSAHARPKWDPKLLLPSDSKRPE